jgi:AsmA protein
MNRGLKIAGIVVAVLIVIVLIIPLFIDANAFRPKLESELAQALGRPAKVGNLSLSLLSGGVTADNISIADDPTFSQSPFVEAKSLKVGVELIPLIFSKTIKVTDVTLDQPEISLVHSKEGDKWNFSSLGNSSASSGSTPATTTPVKPSATSTQPTATTSAPAGGSSTPNFSVGKLKVNNGRLTVSRAGASQHPRVYDRVNIEVTDFAFANSFPFTVTADLPAGGTLKLEGNAGPANTSDAAHTPLQAKLGITHANLAASGFIDPAAGISGIADFDGTVTSDGHELKTNGTLKGEKLQFVKKGAPAGKPLQVQYAVAHDLEKGTGTLKADIIMGKAVAHLNGTYDAHGEVTTVNLKLEGQGLPVDDLEAELPAVGVVLPSGSQLKGGTMEANFTITGPVDKLVTVGTVKLENAALAGFNLGSKLSSISALSGKSGTQQNDTTIQVFSANVRVAPEGTRAENINLVVPSLGTATGAGTVSPSNALDFKMTADNIPFIITGTTSDPKFMPDVKGMASGLMKGAMQGNKLPTKNPLGGLSGMFKKP